MHNLKSHPDVVDTNSHRIDLSVLCPNCRWWPMMRKDQATIKSPQPVPMKCSLHMWYGPAIVGADSSIKCVDFLVEYILKRGRTLVTTANWLYPGFICSALFLFCWVTKKAQTVLHSLLFHMIKKTSFLPAAFGMVIRWVEWFSWDVCPPWNFLQIMF